MAGKQHVEIGEGGSYTPLVVERIGEIRYKSGQAFPLFSFAHYGVKNGDLMLDPYVAMIVAETGMYPISYRNDFAGINYEAVIYDAGGCFESVRNGPQADIVAFCDMWARNLREQQESG